MEQNLKDLRQEYDLIENKNSKEATIIQNNIAYIKETYENPILAPKSRSKNAKLEERLEYQKKRLVNQLSAQDPILARLEDSPTDKPSDDCGKFLGFNMDSIILCLS